MGEVNVKFDVNVDKMVTEVADFVAEVPIQDDDDEDLTIEICVKVEDTNGKRHFGISTEGDFDVMDFAEAHVLWHMLGQALDWNPDKEAS